MLKSAPMEQINAVVFDADIDAVTEEIIKLGVLHLVDIASIASWSEGLRPAKPSQAINRYSELSRKIKEISKKLEIDAELSKTQKKIKIVDVDEMEKTLDKMEEEINPIILEKDIKKEELKNQQKMFNQVKLFAPSDVKIKNRGKYSFLEMVTGQVEKKNVSIIESELSPVPNVIMPFRTAEGKIMLLLIVLKKDKAVLEKAMRESSFEKIEVPEEAAKITGSAQKNMKQKIVELQGKMNDIESKVQDKRDKFLPNLLNFMKFLQAKQMLTKVKAYFKRTERTYLISGWIPKSKSRLLTEAIKRTTGGNCYIEEVTAEKLKTLMQGKANIPVQFSNPSFFKPFELLVSTFGMPEYNTIDPTIFLAITFLIMFGAMFGDVGHGLVLAVLGVLLTRKKKPAVVKAGALSLYCGISSIIFGVLYGSYFGLEEIIPPLWMKPMHNIMHFIVLAILWGVAVISIGIIINLINSFRNRDLAKGLFDKAGLIGGLIYWGAVGIAIKLFLAKEAGLNPGLIIGFIGVPVLLLFFKGPILKLLKPGKKAFPDGVFSYILDITIELVEIFIGYLSNTVSFIRVAAFALAHAGLFVAVFSLADIVKQVHGGMFYSILVLILGNMLIIGLEGLIVTIQGLRLEYYEFFSKFFTGEGEKYKPVKVE